MDPSDITVLIPAAGRVPESVLALSNVSCPAMIPIAGRPVLQWTVEYLGRLGLQNFRVAVPAPGLFVEEFAQCVLGVDHDIQFQVPSPGGLGLTVAELAAGVKTRSALVVLGDTFFEFADPSLLQLDTPAVLVDAVEESYRWCVVSETSTGEVAAFHDKVPGLSPPLRALIGVYWFPDVDVLRDACEATIAEDGPGESLVPVLERIRAELPIRADRAGKWLDCGNPDRQAAAQRTMMQERAFNELSVDETFGTITKRSMRPGKFIDEINYLRLLPPDLAVLFPRVLEFSTEWDQAFVTLEFYGYPTLAELFVLENVDPGAWQRVFEHLERILTDGFLRHARPLPEGAVEAMFLGKVHDRLADISGPPELVELAARPGPVHIDGVAVPNLGDLEPRLADEVAELAKLSQGSIIHGDLCFSNVLYDLRSGICKLIDPRGSFGQAGIFGDPRYDVAKLYHSVHGLYDFITADLFRVSLSGNEASLDIRRRPYHAEVRDRFDQVFFGSGAFDRREVLLISGLIFLSLPALHYDRPERQVAFYLRGLQLVDEALALPRGPQP
jgi:dTDP-glucose pyrophosphorylase